MSDIEIKIRQLVHEKFDVEESKITNDISFVKDLCLDSIDVIELVVEIEKAFRINIPDEEIGKMTTVGSLVKYVTWRVYT